MTRNEVRSRPLSHGVRLGVSHVPSSRLFHSPRAAARSRRRERNGPFGKRSESSVKIIEEMNDEPRAGQSLPRRLM